MEAVEQLAPTVGLKRACEALGINRATFYRRQGATSRESYVRPQLPLKLSAPERQTVVELMHSERFVDTSPILSTPHCSMRGATTVRYGPCTASWPKKAS